VLQQGDIALSFFSAMQESRLLPLANFDRQIDARLHDYPADYRGGRAQRDGGKGDERREEHRPDTVHMVLPNGAFRISGPNIAICNQHITTCDCLATVGSGSAQDGQYHQVFEFSERLPFWHDFCILEKIFGGVKSSLRGVMFFRAPPI